MTLRGCFSLRSGQKEQTAEMTEQRLPEDCYNLGTLSDLKTLFPRTGQKLHGDWKLSPLLAHEVRTCHSDLCNSMHDTLCGFRSPNLPTNYYASLLRKHIQANDKETEVGAQNSAPSRRKLERATCVVALFVCSWSFVTIG